MQAALVFTLSVCRLSVRFRFVSTVGQTKYDPHTVCFASYINLLELSTGSITKMHILIECGLPDWEGATSEAAAWHDCSLGVIMKGAGAPDHQ